MNLPIAQVEDGNIGRVMSVRDLIKATVVCGLSAFFVYEYPVLGQVVLIGALTLLWLSYAYRVIRTARR